MTKAITLLFLLAAINMQSSAQRFDWVSFTPIVNGDGNAGSGGLSITSDEEGNIYTVATFFTPVRIGSDTLFPTGSGNGVYVTKWNSNGEAVDYTAINSGGGNQVSAYALAYDEVNQHIILTVSAYGTITIPNDTTYSGGGNSVQMIRFNKQLKFQSSISVGGGTYNSPVVAKDGFVYSASRYSSEIRKFDVNNQQRWSLALSSGSFNVSNIFLSAADTLYVIGYFMGSGSGVTATYGGVTITAPDPGNNNRVGIFKIDTAGNVVAGKYLAQSHTYLYKLQIDADTQGNVFAAIPYSVSGQVIGTDTLGAITSGSGNDAFVVKLNNQLEPQWVQEFHHTTGANMITNGLAVNSSGKVFVMGYYGGTFKIGSDTFAINQSAGGYLAQLNNASGDVLYATTFGTVVGGSGTPLDVAMSGDKYFISGSSYGTSLTGAQFGCFTETYTRQYVTVFNDTFFQSPTVDLQYSAPLLNAVTNVTNASYQWFLDGVELVGETGSSITPDTIGTYAVKVAYWGCKDEDTLTLQTISTGIESRGALEVITVYPNPSNTVIHVQTSQQLSNLELIDVQGKVLKQHPQANTIDVSNVPQGTYIVRWTDNKGISSHSKVQVLRK